MLYRFNNNLVNVAEISSVCPSQGRNPQYPYDLTIRMKDGLSIGVCYKTEADRNREIGNIQRAFESSVPHPITYREIEDLLRQYTEKVKKDLRQLKALLKEGDKVE